MFKKENIVFCFALQQEAKDHFNDLNCLFTDMGKVNAAFALTNYLNLNPNIELVINLGTCGSKNIAPETIVNSNFFYQRDWWTPTLKMPTDYLEKIEYGLKLDNVLNVSCGTGDSFVEEWIDDAPYDIVDMEAFALATVCKKLNKKFLCLKSISDNADNQSELSAIEQWNNYLEKSSFKFRETIENLNIFV